MELNEIDETSVDGPAGELADETDMTDETHEMDEEKRYLAWIQTLDAIANEEWTTLVTLQDYNNNSHYQDKDC